MKQNRNLKTFLALNKGKIMENFFKLHVDENYSVDDLHHCSSVKTKTTDITAFKNFFNETVILTASLRDVNTEIHILPEHSCFFQLKSIMEKVNNDEKICFSEVDLIVRNFLITELVELDLLGDFISSRKRIAYENGLKQGQNDFKNEIQDFLKID